MLGILARSAGRQALSTAYADIFIDWILNDNDYSTGHCEASSGGYLEM